MLGSCPKNYYRMSEAGIGKKIEEKKNPQKQGSLTDFYKMTLNEIIRTGASIKAYISQNLLGASAENNIFKRLDTVKDEIYKVINLSNEEVRKDLENILSIVADQEIHLQREFQTITSKLENFESQFDRLGNLESLSKSILEELRGNSRQNRVEPVNL